jgi:hypothetical protein
MMDAKKVKRIADMEARKEVRGHESRMHKGVKKMRAGGKTNAEMKKYGRGMAKVMNQRSPMRGSSGPR